MVSVNLKPLLIIISAGYLFVLIVIYYYLYRTIWEIYLGKVGLLVLPVEILGKIAKQFRWANSITENNNLIHAFYITYVTYFGLCHLTEPQNLLNGAVLLSSHPCLVCQVSLDGMWPLQSDSNHQSGRYPAIEIISQTLILWTISLIITYLRDDFKWRLSSNGGCLIMVVFLSNLL